MADQEEIDQLKGSICEGCQQNRPSVSPSAVLIPLGHVLHLLHYPHCSQALRPHDAHAAMCAPCGGARECDADWEACARRSVAPSRRARRPAFGASLPCLRLHFQKLSLSVFRPQTMARSTKRWSNQDLHIPHPLPPPDRDRSQPRPRDSAQACHGHHVQSPRL